MKETVEIINSIFSQASNGFILIGDDNTGYWKFFTKFYTNLSNPQNIDNIETPMLNIQNPTLFVELIQKYLYVADNFYKKSQPFFNLSDIEFKKKLFLDLIINANKDDLNNFENYINCRTNMLTKELPTKEFHLGQYLDFKIDAKITKLHPNLEAPYKFDVFFKDSKGNQFMLPSILFGIENETCHIMAIQNFNRCTPNELSKKLDRFFRKVNKDVNMNNPIGQISPNALVSFTLFNAFLKKQNITNISASYNLAIRQNSNKIVGLNRAKNDIEIKSFLEKFDRIKFNTNEKFLYMFYRYKHHFPNAKLSTDFETEKISLTLPKTQQKLSENIIYQIDKSINPPSKENGNFSK